jgi:hypothetical protein
MKFRKKSTGTKTENLAGGEAFKESPELELISLLLTSFVNDKFYESAKDQLTRLKNLVLINDKKFVAQAAIYARKQFGMRSITHALTAELFGKTGDKSILQGQSWAKRFISKVVFRTEDALEILAYYIKNVMDKSIANQLKKGLSNAVNNFNGYQLAKYKGSRSDVKMVDLVNLTHTKPSKDNESILKKLMSGKLKSTETWEAKLTQAGQEVKEIQDETEKAEKLSELKKESWKDLIENKKLGYFALLRNLRNLESQAPELLDEALKQLTDEKLIKKSLVFPFRFQTAISQVSDRKTIQALGKALEISLSNVPKFDGKTLVVVDESGSMSGKPIEIGSIFAAVLYKVNDADLMTFASDAKYSRLNPDDTASSIAEKLVDRATGGGTDFHSIFKTANKIYDRIIILSDMQGWIGYDSPVKDFEAYKKRTGANPFIYSFDLEGYGTLQLPEDRVFCLAGYSDKIFDVMKLLESDKNALIKEIKKIEI